MLRGLIAATVGRPAVLRRVGALARGPWGWVRSVGILVGGATCLGYAPGAWAQSWEPPRERPLLLEVGAVDRTGEPRWPFGAEDGVFSAEKVVFPLRVTSEMPVWEPSMRQTALSSPERTDAST